ncbi:hypothetical protein GCM10029992_05070 [Glycomyces albus]
MQGDFGGDMSAVTAQGLVPEHAVDIGSGVLEGIGYLGEFEERRERIHGRNLTGWR